jgi:hypothetical protein
MGERKTAERQPFISRMEYLRKGTEVTCGKVFRGVRILENSVSSIRIPPYVAGPELPSVFYQPSQ